MLIIGEVLMSYYNTVSKYNFSNHALERAKTRLKLKYLTESQIIIHCSKLIELSYEIYEEVTFKYIKVNNTNLYFVVDKNENLVITLAPFKPERLLGLLENS